MVYLCKRFVEGSETPVCILFNTIVAAKMWAAQSIKHCTSIYYIEPEISFDFNNLGNPIE